jgi:hypothetical protein
VHGAAILCGGFGEPAPVKRIILVVEEDGLTVVAALDDVERLLRDEIPSETRHDRCLCFRSRC